MNTPLTVAILAGGLTHERDVSLHSGRRIASVLTEAGMHVKVIDVDSNLLQALRAMEPDVVWPLIHGSTGEDGSLQEILDLVGVSYVGPTPEACRMTSDKDIASAVISARGVRVPDSVTIPQKLLREIGVTQILDLVKSRFDFPLVVKPAEGGSALGVSVVESPSLLPRAMVDCYAYGERARIEEYIDGRELAVSVIQSDLSENKPHALPPVEIVTDGPYDFDARYFAGRAQYFVPARLTESDLKSVCAAAEEVFTALDLRHLSRVDMILTDDHEIYVLDVNVSPGMTETSLFPQAAAAEAQRHGKSVDEVYLSILNSALR